MNYQHKELARGRWSQLPFVVQMANIASEVQRALNWRSKNNIAYSRQAAWRAIELIGLTLDGAKSFTRLKELARIKEVFLDYFFGTNEYHSSELSLRKYFSTFTYAARRNH